MYMANDFGAIGKSMDAFASEAASGGFAVNETGGAALLKAIRGMKDWVNTQGNKLYLLEQEPALGNSDGAKTIKPHVQKTASDAQGFATMLTKFGESLAKAEQGINDAMRNYKNNDEAQARRLRPT